MNLIETSRDENMNEEYCATVLTTFQKEVFNRLQFISLQAVLYLEDKTDRRIPKSTPNLSISLWPVIENISM